MTILGFEVIVLKVEASHLFHYKSDSRRMYLVCHIPGKQRAAFGVWRDGLRRVSSLNRPVVTKRIIFRKHQSKS
jgi:hypothetical protein